MSKAGEILRLIGGVEEGIFDPHILKAVFMAGGGGSGKGFISAKMFAGTGLKVVNSDDLFTARMVQAGLNPKTDVGSREAQSIRVKARDVTALKMESLAKGRLGLIIDSTAAKPEKVMKQKKDLDALGYDTSMVFVDTSLEKSQERNLKRDRVVPPEIIEKDWNMVQMNKNLFKKAFSPNFSEVQNDKVMSPEQIQAELTPRLARRAMKMLNKPIKNPKGKQWIKQELDGASKSLLKRVPATTRKAI